MKRRGTRVDTAEVIERLALAVAAGDTPGLAVRRLAQSPPPGCESLMAEIVHRLDRGQRLADALAVWRDVGGLEIADVIDVMLAAERDGGQVAPVLDRLAGEASEQRRREALACARQLPVRLAAPLVVCTLPSFVLLGVVPLVAGALASLDLSLSKGTP